MKKLKRTKQCKLCPWRKDVDAGDIPGGYSTERHEQVLGTIARKGDLSSLTGAEALRVMACHEHPPGQEAYCVGWLENQLGIGNNILLRVKMLGCENVGEIRTIGEQHEDLEDSLTRAVSRQG